MEFGALIPLFYMTMCFFVVTPLVGIVVLAFIRFSLRDTALARNLLAGVLLVCIIWFIFPFGQLLVAAIRICQECPDSDFRITSDVLFNTFRYAFRLALLPGTTSGFILSFLFVVPTTFLLRKRKAKMEENPNL